ncbi:C-myc promoter-binding protein [Saccoglossus kowalevskii]
MNYNMDERGPNRIADYCVLAGLKDTSSLLEYDLQNESGLKVSKPKDPVVDIAVVIKSQGERVPQGFECVETTPTGFSADLNHGSLRSPAVYLCFRRGTDKPPLTDIGILYEGKERVMPGCEIVSTTPCGRPANVNNRTGMGNQRIYITYRRSSETAAHNSLAVTDICVILTNKNEMPPHAFCMIDKNLNKGMTGSDVYLCYKKSMTRANAIYYKAGILSRYPEEDNQNFSLPEEVPLFCLPMGATIECWKAKRMRPLPVFSTFVLTDAKGVKVYGAAVTFYEAYSEDLLTDEQRQKLGMQPKGKEDPYKLLRTLHTNKCICLLSQWPFFEAFKKFLSYLYRLSVSGPHLVPIERHISHFMYEIPFPTQERPRIMLPLAHDALYLTQPQTSPLPLSGASFTALLRNLGPENCLTLLVFAVTEQKILLHSLRPAVLTSVAEAVSTMIFPFTWQCPHIPLCPLGLSDVLSAPLPFIVGMDSRYFDMYEPPADVVCVDLDTNTISQNDERKFMSSKMLPKRPAKQLKNTLTRLATEIYTNPVYSENVDDLAVEMAPLHHDFTKKRKQLSMELSIQEAFLRFMATLFKGYRQYLLPITDKPTEQTTDPSSLFDLQGFLKSRDRANYKLFSQLMKTQSFIRFIEERSFVSNNDASLAFFDECAEKVDAKCEIETKLMELEESFESARTVFVTPPEPINNEKYSYTHFPVLKKELFSPANMHTLAISKSLKSTVPSSPVARRTKQEAKLSQISAKENAKNPKLWAKCLLGLCFSAWFIHLPAYVKSTHSKTKALRTAFEALVKMGTCKLEPPDEICYRVLMQLCGQYGLPVLAVKVLFEMKKSGIQPNAITYGFYNRAVLENEWPATTTSGYILWTKLRNVILAVAQFRRCVKTDMDKISLCSSESSYADGVGRTSSEDNKEFVNDLVKLDSPVAVEDKSSTGGHSDMGYSSMSIDDASRSNSLTTMSPSSPQKSTNDALGTKTKKKTSKSNVAVTESGPVDMNSSDSFRPRVSSIVRNSVGSFGSTSSIGTLRGSTSSTSGLLLTSQNSLEESSVFDSTPESNDAKARKRHKSAGDHSRLSRKMLRNRNFSGDSTATLTLNLRDNSSFESDPGMIKADSFGSDARIIKALRKSDPKLNSSRQKKQRSKRKTKFDLGGDDIDDDIDADEEEDNEEEEEEEEEEEITPSHIRRCNSEGQKPMRLRIIMERDKRQKEEQMKAKEKRTDSDTSEPETKQKSENGEMPRVDSTLDTILLEFDDLAPTKDKSGDSSDGTETDEGKLNPDEDERSRSSSISIQQKPFREETNIQIISSSFEEHTDSKWQADDQDIPHSLPNPTFIPESPSERIGMKTPPRNFSSHFLQGLIQQVTSPPTTTWFGSSPFSKKGSDAGGSTSKLDAIKAAASAMANKFGYAKQKSTSSTATKSSTSSIPQDVEETGSLLSFKEDCDSKHGTWVPHSKSDTNLVGTLLMDESPSTFADLVTGSTPSLNAPLADQSDGSNTKLNASTQSLFTYAMEVNITSCMRCNSCSCVLYDEAIMSGWSADDSNLNTTCCYCGSLFVPFLDITMKDFRTPGIGRAIISPSQSAESMLSIQSAPSAQPLPPPLTGDEQSSVENLMFLNENDEDEIDGDNNGTPSEVKSKENSPRQLKYVRNISSPGDLHMLTLMVVVILNPNSGSVRSAHERRRCTSECLTSGTTQPLRINDKRHRYSAPPQDGSIGGDEEVLSSSISSSIQGSREYLPPQRKSTNPDPVSVPYLSPLVLRKEMENVIDNEGDICFLSSDFVDEHPIIFWNLVWVFKRVELTSNLPGLLLSANSINKEHHIQSSNQWLSRDSRHVLINALWDNPKYQESRPPMYTVWNAIQQGSSVDTLINEQHAFSGKFMQSIVQAIQGNDVGTPIRWLLEQYRKRQPDKRHRSIYRDILFLALIACGRQNIDVDAFDREYDIAFDKLLAEYWGPSQLEHLQEDDKPPNDAMFWCRKIFGEVAELSL